MEILRDANPIELFTQWLEDARQSEPNDAEAMALATVGADMRPSVRMVLLKQADDTGFYFYTNMKSRKGVEISHNKNVALCFHWKSLLRQVRVEGTVTPAPAWVADAYFQSRHPLSRLGAWASEQSQPLDSRAVLEERVRAYAEKFKGQDIPRPPHWEGNVVTPSSIEFWQQGEGRLHDRFLFTRAARGWDVARLNP